MTSHYKDAARRERALSYDKSRPGYLEYRRRKYNEAKRTVAEFERQARAKAYDRRVARKGRYTPYARRGWAVSVSRGFRNLFG